MLTVTNAINPHRLPFPPLPDVNKTHPPMNPVYDYANTFPKIQPFHFGGTASAVNHQPSTKPTAVPPMSFQAFIPTTGRLPSMMAASHSQRIQPQFFTPFLDHTSSLSQGISVNHSLKLQCHLNASVVAQMDDVTPPRKMDTRIDPKEDCLGYGNLTMATPPGGDKISDNDCITDNTTYYPIDLMHPRSGQMPPPRQYTPQQARDINQTDSDISSSKEFESESKLSEIVENCNEENILKVAFPETVSIPDNFIPVLHNCPLESDRLKTEPKSPATSPLSTQNSYNQSELSRQQGVTSSPTNPNNTGSTPDDVDGRQNESQINICDKTMDMDSPEKLGSKDILETERTQLTLEKTNHTCEFKTLGEKKMLLQSSGAEEVVKYTRPDSVNALVVKSLRHSIESILNTNSRKRQNPVSLDAVKQDKADQVDDQRADEYAGLNQASADVKEFERDKHGEQKDIDDDDAISIISVRTDEEICDEKGNAEIDVISCGDGEHPSKMSPSYVKHNEMNSLTPENRFPSPCSHDNVSQPELLMAGMEITGEPLFEKQQKLGMRIHEYFHKASQQSDVNRESSQLLMSRHLKGLEGFIAKEDANHFQKDEFFQAKMQVLHSVSKKCRMSCNQQQASAGHEIFPTYGSKSNSCLSVAPLATIPPFPSLLPTDDVSDIPGGMSHQNIRNHLVQNPYNFPCHRKELNMHPSDQFREDHHEDLPEIAKEESQRSAFKPIVKKSHPSHVPCQSKANSPTTPCLLNSQPSFPVPAAMVLPSSDGVKFPKFLTNISEVNSIDDSVNLDAISLLRFRSKNYQCSGSQDSSFTYSPTPRPNPEAVTMWFSWLRNRNPDAMGSNSVLSKVQPPPRYHCGDCNKTYSTFGGLSKHRQFHCALHVKKEFACKICTKSYSSLGALKMHIRTHTLPCKCHICGKAFSRPWLLQGHVRTHTGEKPFRCNHCGRAFADRSNLRAHLQTHAEIKKYACVKCGKTFSRMSLLTKHSDGSCPANVSQCV